MTWIKQDDKLHRNPKARESSDAAFKVWVLSWSYCGDTPDPTGFMTTAEAHGFVRSLSKPLSVIREIVQRHMWDEVDGGFMVHEFEQGLPKTSTPRVRKFRDSKRSNRVSGNVSETQGETFQSVSPHARAVPEPEPEPVGEQRETEQSLVVQRHMSAANGGPLLPSPRQRVFEAWQRATGKLRAKLDSKRAALIDRALKAYPEDELVDAVRGWRHSAHHRGENEGQTVYDDIELLLRDAKHIEFFRDLERDGGDASLFERAAAELEARGE